MDPEDCVGYHLHPHTRLWYVHPPNAELTADEITKGFVAYKKRDARFAVGSSKAHSAIGVRLRALCVVGSAKVTGIMPHLWGPGMK